jgi:hypothetical protein
MLYNVKELPEIHFMKHRNDNNKDYIDYENQILDKMLSPYMYKNDMMNLFLKYTQPLVSMLFDQMNVMKNFKNYMVDKYEYRHNR